MVINEKMKWPTDKDKYDKNYQKIFGSVKTVGGETMKKVKFTGCSDEQARWGGCNDPRMYLDVGEILEVVDTEVHSWHTKIMLKGQEGLKFNSVCFEEVK